MMRGRRHHPGSGWWWWLRCRKTELWDCQSDVLRVYILRGVRVFLLLPAAPAAMATTGAMYLRDIL